MRQCLEVGSIQRLISQVNLDEFVKRYMRKGKQRLVPARLQAALALLERLREHPSLDLDRHIASRGGSAGLQGHETWGKKAHKRFRIPEAINRTHGRRSSNLREWGQVLLNVLRDAGFERADDETRSELIDVAQASIAAHLRHLLEEDPIRIRLKSRSAQAAIRDVLTQADEKGRLAEVAQYLTGAKLMLRFGINVPVHPVNVADRRSRSDPDPRLGDFEIGDAIIEVAVGPPDEKHISQILNALDDSDREVWLLTKGGRVSMWQEELANSEGIDPNRVVVQSVESFVGQNMTELGGFHAKGRSAKLKELFEIYNRTWIDVVGVPGMRIETIK